MGSMSIWHWIVVLLVVLLLFGRGKISEFMGDLAKGIKSFKKGMAEDETAATTQPGQAEPVKTIDHQTAAATTAQAPAAAPAGVARPVEPGKAS